MAAAAQEGRQNDFMRAMLVLKMGCQRWLEDYGGDTSGFVYKSVKDPRLATLLRLQKRDFDVTPLTPQEGSQSPAGAAQEFCVRSRLCGKAKVGSGWFDGP